MMPLVLILSLLACGMLAANYFLREKMGLLERLGVTLFLALTVVPFVNINYALFGGGYISNETTLAACAIMAVLFGALIFYRSRIPPVKEKAGKMPSQELPVLLLAVLLAVFLFFYYTNKEFLLSLGSYLIKGDAECFYLQTFETVGDMRPDLAGLIKTNPYEIICTPGNILFTSTLISILKLSSFKALYVIILSLLFIFTYLISKKLLGSRLIASITAIFSCLNPYILSVEVLDRNVMALAVSAVMVYLVIAHKNKVFFHGIVFGILAGTGLRFIPLLFILPVALLYYRERLSLRSCLVFIPAFVITFTFNLPHLYFHGFHSLGETSSSLGLIGQAFSGWKRTPFLPFPNLIFYAVNIINYFGYLASAVVLFGALRCWKLDKKLFLALSFMFLSVLFVLSYQRNWLEQDKYRIIISAFLPLYVFFAYGLKGIIEKVSLKRVGLLCSCLLLAVAFNKGFLAIDFPEDTEFYKRRFLYQKESCQYYSLSKRYLSNAGIFPGYKRLFYKIDLPNKAREERVVFSRLFSGKTLPGYAKFNNFYRKWGRDFQGSGLAYPQIPQHAVYDFVKIDFARLGSALSFPVEKVDYADICAIDLEAVNGLFDVYYSGLRINWQEEMLPVSVILNRDETDFLKELDIDLNAFMSFGSSEGAFEKIFPINFQSDPSLSSLMPGMGMNSFPLYSENNTMIFRVPRGVKIVIKNWFVNEKGVPYKVDSWCVRADGRGNYKAEFFYDEPEVYL